MGSLAVDSHYAGDSQHAVANIFNSAIAAAAIATAWEVGLLDSVQSQKQVLLPAFSEEHNLDSDSTQGLVVALASVKVVAIKYNQDQTTSVTAGSLFNETYRTKSLFHWLTLGSGSLFSRMQHVLRNENRQGDFYQRDGAAIAYACREANRQFFDPAFWAVMNKLDYNFRSVVDLGCGSGERLVQILERYPDTTAIGVDVSAAAVGFAETESQKRGFQKRLSFTLDDATNLKPREEFEQVDLLTCFLMGHDFWPRENCIASLRTLRRVFPNLHRFYLCDTTRGVLPSTRGGHYSNPVESHGVVNEGRPDVPIFSLGFEFGHALMGAYIPTIKEWHEVFEEGGWRCVKSHDIPELAFNVLFELAPIK
ncbi:Fc.00g114220.m01.CDS01 [Cosmosporella sp. VM-42]